MTVYVENLATILL